MNTEKHQSEIDQINKHVRMLNITGSIAICALAVAGILMFSDAFESPAVASDVAGSKIISQESKIMAEGVKPFESDINMVTEAATAKAETKLAKASETAAASKKTSSFEEELQSFEASCNNGAISFQWTTLGGTKYAYEIEKTYDQVNYEVFSRAPQPEKKDGKNIYFVEETATSGDDAYYRLRKVIGKGKYEYSESVKVKCNSSSASTATVDVFPNGNGSFRILVNTTVEGNYTITLSDANDTQLVTEQFEAKSGENEFILSSEAITKGNYVLRVSNESMVKERKVLVK